MSILDPSSDAIFPIFGDFGFIKELKVRKLSPKSVHYSRFPDRGVDED